MGAEPLCGVVDREHAHGQCGQQSWEHERGRQPIPVVALTANAMNNDRERCMDAGMSEHLPKPFKQSELQAALMRHLPRLCITA